jgi:hypothetical protein
VSHSWPSDANWVRDDPSVRAECGRPTAGLTCVKASEARFATALELYAPPSWPRRLGRHPREGSARRLRGGGDSLVASAAVRRRRGDAGDDPGLISPAAPGIRRCSSRARSGPATPFGLRFAGYGEDLCRASALGRRPVRSVSVAGLRRDLALIAAWVSHTGRTNVRCRMVPQRRRLCRPCPLPPDSSAASGPLRSRKLPTARPQPLELVSTGPWQLRFRV